MKEDRDDQDVEADADKLDIEWELEYRNRTAGGGPMYSTI